MIIVDRALEKREAEGAPIRVGMVGAGFMARGIAMTQSPSFLSQLFTRRVVQWGVGTAARGEM